MWLQAQLAKQGGVPGHSNNPALLAAMQQHAVPQSHADPLNSGALTAMHSVRQALSERPKSTGMMGGVLDSIGKTLQNVGIAKLRGSHRAPTAELGRMMQTPNEIEESNMAKNMQVLNFLSDQARVEQEAQYRRAALQEQTQHRKASLAEQRRYHDIIGANALLKSAGKKGKNEEFNIPGLDLSQYSPIKTSKERNLYATTLRDAGEARELITRSLKNLNDLEKLSEKQGSFIDPTGSMIPGANHLQNRIYRLSKAGKKRFELSNLLNSDFSNLEIQMEKTLKGGVPDAQTIRRFHEEQVYPGLGQPAELNRKKLEGLLKTIDGKIAASKLSLAAGRHIPLEMFDEHQEEEENAGGALQQGAPPPESISTEALEAELRALKGGH